MKKILLLILGTFLWIALWSVHKTQKHNPSIPIAVNDSFQMRFPNAINQEWYQCDRIYKVKFLLNGNKQEAGFLYTGDIIPSLSRQKDK